MRGLIEHRDLIIPMLASLWWLWGPFFGMCAWLHYTDG